MGIGSDATRHGLPLLAVQRGAWAGGSWWLAIGLLGAFNLAFSGYLAVQAARGVGHAPGTYLPLDFAQYYLPARLVLAGESRDLYPRIRDDNVWLNPGFPGAADPRPVYARFERGFGLAGSCRFIQPPPTAIGLLPLALFDPRDAMFVWVMIQGVSLFVLGWAAALILRLFVGTCTWWEVLLIAGAVLSPRSYSAVRHGNITPLAAACGGAALWGLLRGGFVGNIVAFGGVFYGGLLKYFPGVLAAVPLFAARRWRLTLAVALATIALTAMTYAIVGPAPFRDYFTDILPANARPVLDQSSHAAWYWLVSEAGDRLGRDTALRIVAVAQWIALALPVIVATVARWSARGTVDPAGDRERSAALATCLLSWCCLFSPVSWSHYLLFLIPSAGWLLAKAIGDVRWAVPVAATLLFWLPPWYLLSLPRGIGDFMVWQSPQVTYCLFYLLSVVAQIAARRPELPS